MRCHHTVVPAPGVDLLGEPISRTFTPNCLSPHACSSSTKPPATSEYGAALKAGSFKCNVISTTPPRALG